MQVIPREPTRWDLAKDFYSGPDDPQIEKDIEKFERLLEGFNPTIDSLQSELPSLLLKQRWIEELGQKLFIYSSLIVYENPADSQRKSMAARLRKIIYNAEATALKPFREYIASMSYEAFSVMCYKFRDDGLVKLNMPWFHQLRMFRGNQLSVELESALTKRAGHIGVNPWSARYQEMLKHVVVEYNQKMYSYSEIRDLLKTGDRERRKELMEAMSRDMAGGFFGTYMEGVLNQATTYHAIEVVERKFATPMTRRNMLNSMTDDEVDLVHQAVKEYLVPIAKQYYRLKAKMYGVEKLYWSDRETPVGLDNNKIVISYEKAMTIIDNAFFKFNQPLYDLVHSHMCGSTIYSAPLPEKAHATFSYSCIVPDGKAISVQFLNYKNDMNSLVALAHELGHGFQGIASGKRGVNLQHPPVVISEIFSTYTEKRALHGLATELSVKGAGTEALSVYLASFENRLDTVLRQIMLSCFEQRIHGRREDGVWDKQKALSVKEYTRIWKEVVKMFYGEEGEVFEYGNMLDWGWMVVTHFHEYTRDYYNLPFYVYGYAVSDICSDALLNSNIPGFSELLYEFMGAGGSKTLSENMGTFGVDINDPEFWKDAIEDGIGGQFHTVKKAVELYFNK